MFVSVQGKAAKPLWLTPAQKQHVEKNGVYYASISHTSRPTPVKGTCCLYQAFAGPTTCTDMTQYHPLGSLPVAPASCISYNS